FRVQFQPLGGGARTFTLSNGAMTARLTTQPLGGGAGVITFMDGATQARLMFQPLGGGAQVLSFNSTGNITAPQLLFLTGALNRNFVPPTAAFNPWTSAAWGGAGYGAGAAGYGAGSGGYGGGGNYISSSAPPNESPPIYSTRQPTQTGQSIVF